MYTKDCCGQSASAPVDLAIKCLPVIPGRLGANVRESMAAHYTVKEVTLDVFHVKVLSVSAQLNIQTSIHPSSLRWECTLHRDSGHLSLKPFPVFSCVSKDAAPSWHSWMPEDWQRQYKSQFLKISLYDSINPFKQSQKSLFLRLYTEKCYTLSFLTIISHSLWQQSFETSLNDLAQWFYTCCVLCLLLKKT